MHNALLCRKMEKVKQLKTWNVLLMKYHLKRPSEIWGEMAQRFTLLIGVSGLFTQNKRGNQ